jgi:hypothetical protein
VSWNCEAGAAETVIESVAESVPSLASIFAPALS